MSDQTSPDTPAWEQAPILTEDAFKTYWLERCELNAKLSGGWADIVRYPGSRVKTREDLSEEMFTHLGVTKVTFAREMDEPVYGQFMSFHYGDLGSQTQKEFKDAKAHLILHLEEILFEDRQFQESIKALRKQFPQFEWVAHTSPEKPSKVRCFLVGEREEARVHVQPTRGDWAAFLVGEREEAREGYTMYYTPRQELKGRGKTPEEAVDTLFKGIAQAQKLFNSVM